MVGKGLSHTTRAARVQTPCTAFLIYNWNLNLNLAFGSSSLYGPEAFFFFTFTYEGN